MKKLATLLLAAGMVVAASAPASAVDVKVDGEYMFSFSAGEYFGTGNNFDTAGQRLRLGLTFTTSEDLSGYVQLQAGIDENDNTGYDWGSHNHAKSKLGVRQAYIDWMIPHTTVKVRMGKQLVGLPTDAFGQNGIMHPGVNSRDGIVLTSPVTDWLDLTAFWVRAGYDNQDDNDTSTSGKSDVFALSGAMKFDGFSITPYVMYGSIDENAVSVMKGSSDGKFLGSGNAFWAGLTTTMNYFDPFTLKLSGAYGMVSYDASTTGENFEDRSGWYIQGKASYKTAYGTPILGAWYGSGDDSDSKYAHQNWIPTNGGRFFPTFGFSDSMYGLPTLTVRYNIAGTWGIQAGIEDVSFLEDLTHKFTVTMFKGTNSDKWSADTALADYYMTTSDAAVEFNLDSTYQIYKNLAANLQLAYIINDFDDEDHKGTKIDEDAWIAALSFAYKF